MRLGPNNQEYFNSMLKVWTYWTNESKSKMPRTKNEVWILQDKQKHIRIEFGQSQYTQIKIRRIKTQANYKLK